MVNSQHRQIAEKRSMIPAFINFIELETSVTNYQYLTCFTSRYQRDHSIIQECATAMTQAQKKKVPLSLRFVSELRYFNSQNLK